MLLQPFSSFLFGRAANLADHDDTVRFRVIGKSLQAIDEVRAVEGVATYSYTGRLAETRDRRLMDGLVGQGTRPRNNSNFTFRQYF